MEGRTFHILTDHKPLTFALASQSSSHSPCQTRQLDFISQFTSDIRHIKGTDNPVAGALSRIDIDALSVTRLEGIDFERLAAGQQQDPEIKYLLAHTCSQPCSFCIEPIPLQSSTTTLYLCDVTTWVPRPSVSGRKFFVCCTHYLILAYVLHNGSLSLVLSGHMAT